MLAARDQENLVHGHHAAAAAKPLNQGTKQLPPKTPGRSQLAPKTPFRVPLNDENGAPGQGGLRTILKTSGKGNENYTVRGKKTGGQDKTAFVTPSAGPRAPLGAKTANAKTKAFQTPAAAPKDNAPKDSVPKDAESAPKSTTRKPRPRVSHAEMTKVEVFSGADELLERDIEYMPPPPKDLPNDPDDLPELNLSMFADGNLTRGCLAYYLHEPDATGTSYAQRRAKEHDDYLARLERRQDALDLKEYESTPFLCLHEPRCPPNLCKSNATARKAAEEKCRKTLAELALFPKDREPLLPAKEKKAAAKGPALATAKRAAISLSQTKPTASNAAKALVPKAPVTNSRLHTSKPSTSFLKSRKKTPPPTNPSPMRATAAAVASRQTIGYSKGRSTSSTLRDAFPAQPKKLPSDALPTRTLKRREVTPVPEPEVESLGEMEPRDFAAKYGQPEHGSEMWFRCRALGLLEREGDEDQEVGAGKDGSGRDVEGERGGGVEDWFREEAEAEFVFVLDDDDDEGTEVKGGGEGEGNGA